MALRRSDFSANEKVQLVSLCYKDAPLGTGEPGQLLRPGEYLAKELPNGAFATGLVRKLTPEEAEEKPKAAASKPKAETKPSDEGDKQ